jgi:acyl carrier protein
MDRRAILHRLNKVFVETLDNEAIILAEETTANDVAEWDSLSHIQLVVEVEKEFGIRFTAREIQGWKTIGEMIDSISTKTL